MGSIDPAAARRDPEPAAAGWLTAALNQGWIYRDRVESGQAGLTALAFYAGRYRHSSADVWLARLQAGEIDRAGRPLGPQERLASGDQLRWQRPPWREEAVPLPGPPLWDDGDLLVLDKPAGLPVLPAGGWLEHTLLRILERRHRQDPAGLPRPVHRLGRTTSGLLVCARRPATRAWLSRLLRDSTAADQRPEAPPSCLPPRDLPLMDLPPQNPLWTDCWLTDLPPRDPAAQNPLLSDQLPVEQPPRGSPSQVPWPACRKLYRALLQPGLVPLQPGESRTLRTAIGRRPHPRLGLVWCAVDAAEPQALQACSRLTLLARSPRADLVAVAIASGRPHQIRIHCAAFGAPLLGDPLYRAGGGADPGALPGDGGYRLQAWRLELTLPTGEPLTLTVQQPLQLEPAESRDP
ncbi:MAG: RluA family pseudouridine synthase [Synechococcus sp.]|nr:RluA family pseudouridine synthase [Synechococcus sp.]